MSSATRATREVMPGDVFSDRVNFGSFEIQIEWTERGAPPLPEASITARGSPITEGATAMFAVALTMPAPMEGLNVALMVSETGGDHVEPGNEGAKTLNFAEGEDAKGYSVPTVNDAVDEGNGTVTVTIVAGEGYEIGSASSASVTVNDDDEPLPVPGPGPGFTGAGSVEAYAGRRATDDSLRDYAGERGRGEALAEYAGRRPTDDSLRDYAGERT